MPDQPGQAYYFWRGINPAALLALARRLLHLFSFAQSSNLSIQRSVRHILQASLPAAGMAALVYFMASQFVIRAGRGGYRSTRLPDER